MASTLSLSDGSVTVDLLSSSLFVLADGWSTKTDDLPVWDVFEVVHKNTSLNLILTQATLEKFKEIARRYASDNREVTRVYLIYRAEGESEKRTTVLDLDIELHAEGAASPLFGLGVARITIAVLHTPYYESITTTTYSTTGLSAVGTAWAVTTSVIGTIARRIEKTTIATATSQTLYKIWIGIRRIRHGTTNFTPLLEAENCVHSIADSSDVADATARGGVKTQITFATSASMTQRWYLRIAEAIATAHDHMIGQYLILARVKLSSATTEVRVQLRHGWSTTGTENDIAGDTYLSAVENSNLTNWNLVELGIANIPSNMIRWSATLISLDTYYFNLLAERISASGSLDIDYLVLIPTDGLAIIERADINSTLNEPLLIRVSPLDEIFTGRDEGSISRSLITSIDNWNIPHDGAVIVAAAQEETQHQLTPTLNLTLDTIARYRLIRSD